jgi:hypothetical protein
LQIWIERCLTTRGWFATLLPEQIARTSVWGAKVAGQGGNVNAAVKAEMDLNEAYRLRRGGGVSLENALGAGRFEFGEIGPIRLLYRGMTN